MECSYCQKSITSGKYLTDYWGNNYHAEHLQTIPKCNYCGRLISKKLTNGGRVFSNGSSICGICSNDSIDNRSQTDKEYKFIVEFMAQKGFDIRKYKTEIFLVDREQNPKLKNEEPGFINFKMKKVNDKITDISFKIYILKSLPRTYFIETLAHELMHQWLILFGKDKMKPALNEGSCNYISYLVMNEIKTPLSYFVIDRLLKDPHPHYGKGFRKVLSYSKRNGNKAVIIYLKSRRTI